MLIIGTGARWKKKNISADDRVSSSIAEPARANESTLISLSRRYRQQNGSKTVEPTRRARSLQSSRGKTPVSSGDGGGRQRRPTEKFRLLDELREHNKKRYERREGTGQDPAARCVRIRAVAEHLEHTRDAIQCDSAVCPSAGPLVGSPFFPGSPSYLGRVNFQFWHASLVNKKRWNRWIQPPGTLRVARTFHYDAIYRRERCIFLALSG